MRVLGVRVAAVLGLGPGPREFGPGSGFRLPSTNTFHQAEAVVSGGRCKAEANIPLWHSGVSRMAAKRAARPLSSHFDFSG